MFCSLIGHMGMHDIMTECVDGTPSPQGNVVFVAVVSCD